MPKPSKLQSGVYIKARAWDKKPATGVLFNIAPNSVEFTKENLKNEGSDYGIQD